MKIKDLEQAGGFGGKDEVALVEAAAARWADRKDDVETVAKRLKEGRIDEVESEDRIRKFFERRIDDCVTPDLRGSENVEKTAESATTEDMIAFAQERIIEDTDIQPIEFLERGCFAARAVGRIDRGGEPRGSGFLIGHNLVMTNHHVISESRKVGDFELVMDFEENFAGTCRLPRIFCLEADRFFYTNSKLDFTIVGVNPTCAGGGADISDFGSLRLDRQWGKALIGNPANIVQHPAGSPKKVALRNARVIFLDTTKNPDNYLYYKTDTKKGSSGSPVFNDRWEVVALHHASVPRRNKRGELIDKQGKVISKARAENDPGIIVWEANEGIRVSKLVGALEAGELENPDHETTREQLLALWERPQVTGSSVGPLAGDGNNEATGLKQGEGKEIQISAGRTITITIKVD